MINIFKKYTMKVRKCDGRGRSYTFVTIFINKWYNIEQGGKGGHWHIITKEGHIKMWNLFINKVAN